MMKRPARARIFLAEIVVADPRKLDGENVRCGRCHGRMIIYPNPRPTGTGFCEAGCSPKALKPLLEAGYRQLRRETAPMRADLRRRGWKPEGGA